MQAAMDSTKLRLKALQDTTWRRLRITPTYFLLFWRWSTWLHALIVIVFVRGTSKAYYNSPTTVFLLVAIGIYTLILTLNSQPFQVFTPLLNKIPFFAPRSRRAPSEDEDAEVLAPLARSQHHVWNITLHTLDVIICGLAMYFAGGYSTPPFGNGSPFYRYGMSSAFAAALTYRYRGAIIAALGYDCFALLGMFVRPPGAPPYPLNVIDITGSLMDTPIAGIVAAFLVTLIANYARSKKREQDNVRRQRALLDVGEIIMHETSDRQRLLQRSAEQLRRGGHFQRLVIALINSPTEDENDGTPQGITNTIEVTIPDSLLSARDDRYLTQVQHSRRRLVEFEKLPRAIDRGYGIARIYVPIFKDEQIQLILGAESRRQTPFDLKQAEFLNIAGGQLSVALDNIRLVEQTIGLAATAERTRIAREIHDGIAQLTYMLSLQAETCATQAHRIAEASEEDSELITPLAQRLDKLVAVSKQALWETRNYMFSLKPLMSGTTTLTQMISNQVREFEAISDLPVLLEIEGNEITSTGNLNSTRRQAQVGAAIFRIVQEALTNAYKHAEATQLEVRLLNQVESIEVEIADNGSGFRNSSENGATSSHGEQQRVYSGHGLNGMRERAEELGGTFEVLPATSSGVKVRARIPL